MTVISHIHARSCGMSCKAPRRLRVRPGIRGPVLGNTGSGLGDVFGCGFWI